MMSLFGQVCVFDEDEKQFLDDVGHYHSEQHLPGTIHIMQPVFIYR